MNVMNVNGTFKKTWSKFLEIKWTKVLQNLPIKVLKDSNYTVLRTLIENLDTVKYPSRYVNIYYVDTVNNTHSVNKL